MTYLAFFLFFIPLPVLLGAPLLKDKEKEPYPWLFSWALGFLILFAAGYVPALIGVFADLKLDYVFYIWLIILTLGAGYSTRFLTRHRQFRLSFGKRKGSSGKRIEPTELLCLLLVLFHAYVTFRYMHVDDDDAVYIAAATTSLDTDTVMHYNPMTGNVLAFLGQNDTSRICVSPLHVLYACISRLFGLRPAALAHTYLPPLLTVLFYVCVAMAGSLLFQKDRSKTALFTIFVYLVNICSYVSIYTSGTFLSVRSWQGKGFLIGAVLPLLIWYYLHLAENGGRIRFQDTLILLLLYGTAGLLTVMGMVLLCIMGAILTFLVLVKTRKIKVLLQFILCMIPPAFITALYFAVSKRLI